MERTGEVTDVRGEFLEITFCRPSDCEKCHACMGGQSQTKLVVRGEARKGDAAVVEMPVKSVMKASAIAYVMPLVGLMAGMFAGAALVPSNRDIGGLAGAGIGLAVSVAVLLLTERKRKNDPQWQPRLLRVIPLSKGE